MLGDSALHTVILSSSYDLDPVKFVQDEPCFSSPVKEKAKAKYVFLTVERIWTVGKLETLLERKQQD